MSDVIREARISEKNKARRGELERRDIYGELVALRDDQRAQREESLLVVQGDELPWEVNPQGIMRWYMAPTIDDTALSTLIVYLQRIPTGSRSGRQMQQGNIVGYVWKGSGHSVIGGETVAWAQGAMIQIPLRGEGCEYQHFAGDESDAEILWFQPNLTNALGVDRGSGFEQLEPCPEYEANHR